MNHENDDGFQGRVALVTGAGGGMGREIAIALGKVGASVAVHYRGNQKGAEQVVADIMASGSKAVALQGDLSDADQVAKIFDQLDQAFDRPIEMLVNNAGEWMDKKPILDCSLEQWNRMLAVNATSVFLCCQQAGRRMVKQDRGSIVNIGSLAGRTGGGGGTVPYAAAKAAVHTLTYGLAKELGPQGIRVNGIAPGMVRTPMLKGRVSDEAEAALCKMSPLGRFGQPEEMAPVVLMLLSSAGSYLTGQIIDVNGGLMMH